MPKSGKYRDWLRKLGMMGFDEFEFRGLPENLKDIGCLRRASSDRLIICIGRVGKTTTKIWKITSQIRNRKIEIQKIEFEGLYNERR